MSYCRFAWYGSDVYVYESDQGFECCGCSLQERGVTTDTPEAMIAHLAEHKRAGDFVPPFAIESLWADIEGPNRAVRPEPEQLTQCRLQMDRFRDDARAELAAEFSHL